MKTTKRNILDRCPNCGEEEYFSISITPRLDFEFLCFECDESSGNIVVDDKFKDEINSWLSGYLLSRKRGDWTPLEYEDEND